MSGCFVTKTDLPRRLELHSSDLELNVFLKVLGSLCNAGNLPAHTLVRADCPDYFSSPQVSIMYDPAEARRRGSASLKLDRFLSFLGSYVGREIFPPVI